MTQEAIDFIEHYGKMGMKWGKRSGGSSGSGGKTKSVRKESSDYKVTVPLRNRKTHELTNKQLKTASSRITAEQNYKRLNPGKVQKGHDAVKGILALAGTAAAVYTLSKSPLGKATIGSIRKSPAGKASTRLGTKVAGAILQNKIKKTGGIQLRLFK